MKTIYLVTHGPKEKIDSDSKQPIPDPPMTKEGWEMVKRLRPGLEKLLPDGPVKICCGLGLRNWQVVIALNLNEDEGGIEYAETWGTAASALKTKDKTMVILASGLIIAWDQFKGPHFRGPSIRQALTEYPEGTVICSGRPVLTGLGMKPEQCQSGALYSLMVRDDPTSHDGISINIVPLIEGARTSEITDAQV